MGIYRRFEDWLFGKVDNIALIFYRILWGGILFSQTLYWVEGSYARLHHHFYATPFHAKYFLREWVVVPEDMFYLKALTTVMLVFSAFFCLGLLTRLSLLIWLLSFSYLYYLDTAHYLNHYYLVQLVCILSLTLPLSGNYSLDCLLGLSKRTEECRRWNYFILRLQVAIVYFYAATAKIEETDWLRGEPLRHWMHGRGEEEYFGDIFRMKGLCYMMSYGGIFVDMFASIGLWQSRHRYIQILAHTACLSFHCINHYIFE